MSTRSGTLTQSRTVFCQVAEFPLFLQPTISAKFRNGSTLPFTTGIYKINLESLKLKSINSWCWFLNCRLATLTDAMEEIICVGNIWETREEVRTSTQVQGLGSKFTFSSPCLMIWNMDIISREGVSCRKLCLQKWALHLRVISLRRR